MNRTWPALKFCEPRVLVSAGKDRRWIATGKAPGESSCRGFQGWVYIFSEEPSTIQAGGMGLN